MEPGEAEKYERPKVFELLSDQNGRFADENFELVACGTKKEESSVVFWSISPNKQGTGIWVWFRDLPSHQDEFENLTS
jgi:hypothetical protein